MVVRLYAAIDRVLKPIVAAEERRADANRIGAPRRSPLVIKLGFARSTIC